MKSESENANNAIKCEGQPRVRKKMPRGQDSYMYAWKFVVCLGDFINVSLRHSAHKNRLVLFGTESREVEECSLLLVPCL